MPDKDPITEEEWAKGVTIERWLEANTPEAYREAVQNKTWVRTIPSSPSEDMKDLRYWPAVKQCRKELLGALERKELELRTRTRRPPNSELLTWEVPPPDTVSEIAAKWSYGGRGGEAYLKELGRYVQVQVFRRRHRKESPRSLQTWVVDRLVKIESEYQAEIVVGKALRKPLIEELMEQLIKENPKLSKTAFRNGWKGAQKRGLIPGIGKAGAPKGPRRSRG